MEKFSAASETAVASDEAAVASVGGVAMAAQHKLRKTLTHWSVKRSSLMCL
jgi:hypothetical protein